MICWGSYEVPQDNCDRMTMNIRRNCLQNAHNLVVPLIKLATRLPDYSSTLNFYLFHF